MFDLLFIMILCLIFPTKFAKHNYVPENLLLKLRIHSRVPAISPIQKSILTM